jgi:cation diffusion facilitator CzcD-associated flavoprotein CzcO
MPEKPELNGAGYMSGSYFHRYLKAWAKHVGVDGYIRFQSKVDKVSRHEDGKRWTCAISDGKLYVTRKLIVALGIASYPNYPTLDTSKFTKPVMHGIDFGPYRDHWDVPECKTVAVLGAGKGATDVLMALVKAGKKVKVG